MSLRSRIDRIAYTLGAYENGTGDHSAQDDSGPIRGTVEHFLIGFEQEGRNGTFDHEPDFQGLLDQFRKAVETAQTSSEFIPPASYSPELPDHLRYMSWRTSRFPEVGRALAPLLELG